MIVIEEIWKDIEGYEGLYQISNTGKVKSFYGKGRILKPSIFNNYSKVTLNHDGNSRTFLVHRLVAIAFIPNIYNKPEVNHKDGNKLNNVVTNLEWVNSSENQIHAVVNGLQSTGENSVNSKLTNEEVEEIRSLYIPNKYGHGCRTLAKKYGVNSGTIWNIVNNKYWRWI